MAVRWSTSPCVLVQKSGPVLKPSTRNLMPKRRVPIRRSLSLQIRPSCKSKVFEDACNGIVCYRDENGDIVCEGYDEGPRFEPQVPRLTYHPRDAEIMDLLQQNWLRIVNGGEINNDKNGVLDAKEDFNANNGFSSFL